MWVIGSISVQTQVGMKDFPYILRKASKFTEVACNVQCISTVLISISVMQTSLA